MLKTFAFHLQVPDKREIKTHYRGWLIKVKVSCLSEQINVEMACVLQGLGVDSGSLDPLYCEHDLIKGRSPVDANKVGTGGTESGTPSLQFIGLKSSMFWGLVLGC